MKMIENYVENMKFRRQKKLEKPPYLSDEKCGKIRGDEKEGGIQMRDSKANIIESIAFGVIVVTLFLAYLKVTPNQMSAEYDWAEAKSAEVR